MTFLSKSCVTQSENSRITVKYSLAELSMCLITCSSTRNWQCEFFSYTHQSLFWELTEVALIASCRWKKMTSRTPTFIKNSLVHQSTAHQSISTTNLKNNLHTVQYKLLHKYIDFYQPFIVKRSRASCNMHPAQVMQNIPKPELKILASNMSSQGIWLQTHGKTIINRQNYNLKFLFLDQHKC